MIAGTREETGNEVVAGIVRGAAAGTRSAAAVETRNAATAETRRAAEAGIRRRCVVAAARIKSGATVKTAAGESVLSHRSCFLAEESHFLGLRKPHHLLACESL